MTGHLRSKSYFIVACAALFATTMVVGHMTDAYAQEANEILKQLKKIDNQQQSSDFRVDLKVDGDEDTFKIGDEIKLRSKTAKDCYLTLINIGPTGKPVVIFPNNWTKSSYVKAGVEYSIPPGEGNYSIVAREPFGVEVVKAVASLKPLTSLDQAKMTQAGDFKVLDEPQLVMKGIGMELGKQQTSQWSTSDVVFSVEKK